MSDETRALKVRRSVACIALGISLKQLYSLKLKRWKEGKIAFFDPEQIGALIQLRDHWQKTTPR